MKRGVVAIAVAVLLAAAFALAGGCGGGGETVQERDTAPDSSVPPPEEVRQPMTEPIKTLADFPDDQDGAALEAAITTEKGEIVLQFYPDVAPVTVASFLNLARSGYYNGLRFHRVVDGFVVQGGDPLSRNPDDPYVGTGSPGYRVPAEFSDRPHEAGTLSMARSQDPNSGGSQFYICLEPQPSLDGQYTVFGLVVSGMDVVNSIVQGDVMNEIVIRPRSG